MHRLSKMQQQTNYTRCSSNSLASSRDGRMSVHSHRLHTNAHASLALPAWHPSARWRVVRRIHGLCVRVLPGIACHRCRWRLNPRSRGQCIARRALESSPLHRPPERLANFASSRRDMQATSAGRQPELQAARVAVARAAAAVCRCTRGGRAGLARSLACFKARTWHVARNVMLL